MSYDLWETNLKVGLRGNTTTYATLADDYNLKQPPEHCVRSSHLFLDVAFCHSITCGILANTTDSIVLKG